VGIREDVYPIVDAIRQEVVDEVAELRIHTVQVRTRTWSGAEKGRGTASDSTIDIEPKPRVRDPSPRERLKEPGRFQDGDRLVDQVSVAYGQEDLDGVGAIDPATEELFWLIDGDPYRVVRVTEKYLAWEVQLRAMRQRPDAD
jgi:hypothetical protein